MQLHNEIQVIVKLKYSNFKLTSMQADEQRRESRSM